VVEVPLTRHIGAGIVLLGGRALHPCLLLGPLGALEALVGRLALRGGGALATLTDLALVPPAGGEPRDEHDERDHHDREDDQGDDQSGGHGNALLSFGGDDSLP
jgi:hypothetical protein